MHIEYLKYFYEVASIKSISKVAISSHISQPALSQQIQRLEDSLGFKLLERSNKGVELTEAGQAVKKYAKNIIKSYENMLEDLIAIKENNCTMRIEACPAIATYALPCTVYKIKEEFPNYNYSLLSSMSDEIEYNILKDECDVGFMQGKPTDQDLISSKIGIDRMVLVASADFNIKDEITLNELDKYPLILMNDKFICRKQFNETLKDKGFDAEGLNILFSLDSTESIKSSVLKGYGLSLLPYISIKKELYNKQLKEIKVKDFEILYEIYIVYKRDKIMYRGSREFIQFLKKNSEKSFC